jgi:hypothetical protein
MEHAMHANSMVYRLKAVVLTKALENKMEIL